MGFFSKLFEGRETSTGIIHLSATQKMAPKRGSSELLQAYSTCPTFASVVNAVAQDVSSNLLTLWDVRGSEARQVNNSPVMDLLYRQFMGLTGQQKLWLIQVGIDLIGEAAFEKIYDGPDGRTGTKLVNLFSIPGTWVTKRALTEGEQHEINNQLTSQIYNRNYNDVIWFLRPDPYNPYQRGSGIGRTLGDEIDITELASKTIKRWFLNGGKPDVLIIGEGMTKEDQSNLEQKWEERHGGVLKRYLPAFMGGSNVQVHRLSSNFNDLQLSQLRQDERRVIQQTFGVPAEIIGDALNSNRATITAASQIYGERVLIPRLTYLCQVLNICLVQPMAPGHEIRYTNPVKEDRDFKLSVYAAAPYAFRVNEWRKLAGDDPLPGDEGDVYMLNPMNMPVSSPSEEIEAVQAPAGAKAITKAASEADITAALAKHPMARVLIPEIAAVVKYYGEGTYNEFSPPQKAAESFAMTTARVAAFLRDKSAQKIKGIEDTTRDQIMDVLGEGRRELWTIDEIAQAVEDVMDDGDKIRAWTIARTETGRAASFANQEAGQQLGIERKEWLTTMDGREREDHKKMNGQIVDMDQSFTGPNGEKGMYPGDFPEAEMSINCRCTVLPVIGEKSMYDTIDKREKRFDQHDRARTRFEVKIRRSVRKVFAEQKQAVLAAIRGV